MGRLLTGPGGLRLLQFRPDGADNLFSDLILQLENSLNRALEAVCPQMRSGRCVNQLRHDPHAI